VAAARGEGKCSLRVFPSVGRSVGPTGRLESSEACFAHLKTSPCQAPARKKQRQAALSWIYYRTVISKGKTLPRLITKITSLHTFSSVTTNCFTGSVLCLSPLFGVSIECCRRIGIALHRPACDVLSYALDPSASSVYTPHGIRKTFAAERDRVCLHWLHPRVTHTWHTVHSIELVLVTIPPPNDLHNERHTHLIAPSCVYAYDQPSSNLVVMDCCLQSLDTRRVDPVPAGPSQKAC